MNTRLAVRLLWCLVGAACGIALSLAVAGPPVTPFLLASLGGTAVFLFGLTRAPAAQPRALFGELSPSSHKFDDVFIPSGLSAEGAMSRVWRCRIRHCICDSKH